MIYYIDDAYLEGIKQINECFPVHGVTTNPSIIAKGGKDVLTTLKEIRKIIGEDKTIFAQVLSGLSEDQVKEARVLREAAGENFSVKIPVTTEGLKTIRILKDQGYNVTATAIFTASQALMAANCNADFVAPYVNRIDNFGVDGNTVVEDIIKIFKASDTIQTKVIAASFKNCRQVLDCALAGCDSATVPCELFNQLLFHSQTADAIYEFEMKGRPYYTFKF